MPRQPRPDLSGSIVHVLNRAVRRATLFSSAEDYAAFMRVLQEVKATSNLRILAFCVMPNHWHFVVWPTSTQELSEFMKRLSLIHAVRWHGAHQTSGTGSVYQGRFKAFPVEPADAPVLRVLRYVERNALRASLVDRAEAWPWGSLWHRVRGDRQQLLSAGASGEEAPTDRRIGATGRPPRSEFGPRSVREVGREKGTVPFSAEG